MNRGQSPAWSLIEVITDDILGWLLHTAERAIIFPFFGVHISLGENLLLGLVFNVSSMIRKYGIRRGFNWWNVRGTITASAP